MLNNLRGGLPLLALGLIAGFILGSLFLDYQSSSSRAGVEQGVKKFYELVVPGSTAEVMNVKEDSGLYKVLSKVVSPSGTAYQEAYVTRDGRLLATLDSMILVKESIDRIEKSKNFVDCLFDKGIRVYGVLDQDANPQGAQATSLQLSVLGGIYSPKLYVSCDGQLVQQCLDLGVSQVPSIVFGNEITIGIKAVDWFVEKTGCKPG